jgi:signal transduction histidine kinase
MARDRSSLVLIVAFVVIGAGFLASTLVAETRASAIDREVTDIATNSLPSVAHLVAARGALRHIEVAAERIARSSAGPHDAAEQALRAARSELDGEVEKELETPSYPGERAAAATAQLDIAQLEALLDHWEAVTSEEGAAGDVELHDSADRTDKALQRWLALNAREGQAGVTRIIAIRRDSMKVALGLDAACLALAVAAALMALRALRKSREVEAKNARDLGERADELENFAKRVAHDLLSPLSALTYCLHAFKRVAETDPTLTDALRRARACVARAQTMVDGIFEFARAGAHPGSAGRADLRQAVEQVSEEVRGLETGTEVVIEPFDGAEVACSPGVLLSIVANLVRNAVKYMSDSAMKRVTVRVARIDGAVRVEVEDTGPGVPEGMELRIFDPYVRADGVTQAGIGLGLATVKRLCEAHGGTVGVRSTLGRGSTFWFTLPRPTL